MTEGVAKVANRQRLANHVKAVFVIAKEHFGGGRIGKAGAIEEHTAGSFKGNFLIAVNQSKGAVAHTSGNRSSRNRGSDIFTDYPEFIADHRKAKVTFQRGHIQQVGGESVGHEGDGVAFDFIIKSVFAAKDLKLRVGSDAGVAVGVLNHNLAGADAGEVTQTKRE